MWVWRGACAWTTPATLCSGVPAVVWRAMVDVDGMLGGVAEAGAGRAAPTDAASTCLDTDIA